MKRIIPHLSIAASFLLIVLYVVDRINHAMGFLRGDEFETLLLIACILSIISAVLLIIQNRRGNDKQ